MNQGLLFGLCLLCCLSAGEALTCYYCPYGRCFLPTTVTCSGVQICDTASASASSSVAGVILKGKGCLGIFSCLSSSKEYYEGVEFTVSHSCCFGSLCNATSFARPSLLVGLLSLMASLLMKFL
ncbi:hypothetical protein NDU88_000882 [Pleurodeles waltl]|uniref:UPAR/Ly6 domain-containing protein n=1 Tax=Pleurodeles waltl TaxID=8319 RepID=A0AAV7Q2N7_PLEWA|nr:hypothetical protein NDU88_000882 [Pleurodeles waltl]